MKACVFTVSDRCYSGQREDRSGPLLAEILEAAGWRVTSRFVVPDSVEKIRVGLKEASARFDLLVTTGGTGVSSRDVTPEAVAPILSKALPGLAELMRIRGLEQSPFAALSRSLAGTIDRCLVVCLPGNPEGAAHSLKTVLPLLKHALQIVRDERAH